MRSLIFRAVVWGFLLQGLPAIASAAELTFYCSFDGTADAKFAAGEKGAVYRTLQFTEGLHGQALAVPDSKHIVCFDEAGNLPKDRGTIEFWIKADWDGSDSTSRALVWEESEGRPRDVNSAAITDRAIWFWKCGSTIRFEIHGAGGHYAAASIAKWQRGQWHHLAACYDCAWGARLFVDGLPAGEGKFTWKPKSYGAFSVGGRLDRGQPDQPAQAVIDELKIYNAPLSAGEAARAYRGQLQPQRAKSPVVRPAVPAKPAPARLIFRLPLDGDLTAATAEGRREPIGSQGVAWTEGMVGKAARFGPGSKLVYSAAGNLHKDRGTIALWYRPDAPPESQGRRAFFREKGPNEKGQNALWFWLSGQHVRFDVRDPANKFQTQNAAAWQPDQWHFLVATWNARRGRNLYVDGVPARARDNVDVDSGDLAWETKTYEEFFVGSDGGRDVAAGAISDFRIYDRPLAADEIAREYQHAFPVEPLVVHPYFLQGKNAPFSWQLRNRCDGKVRGTLRWELLDAGQLRLASGGAAPVSLAAGEAQSLAADIRPQAAGPMTLRCHWAGQGASASYERTVNCWVIAPESPQTGGLLHTRLLQEIDCTQSLDRQQFVDDGQSRVARFAGGAYREAGGTRHSRFAYRVKAVDVGQPHLVEWDYPDYKARTMEVVLQATGQDRGMYDLQTGVFCGGEYPVSGQMLTEREVVWPRTADQALVFMTAEKDRPAAVAKIRIARIEGGLARLAVREAPSCAGWRRMVGLYYEDPVLALNFGGQQELPGFAAAADRLLDYMDYSGQNVLLYPGMFYQGPLFPSRYEPQTDSQQGRPHPSNFIEYLCLRMGRRGMQFIPTFNVHSLPSLVRNPVTDDREIRGGRETTLMMMWNNRPKTVGWHGTPPNYNPLSAEARQQITRLVDEMLDLYGDLPAFKGICFHLSTHSMLWFGNLDAGYNDCNIERFEAETGRRIPVDRNDPLRFNKRYRWLMENARAAWIDWRCRAIHDYYAAIARHLAARRSDLRMVLNLFAPSSPEEMVAAAQSLPQEELVAEFLRQGGVDIRQFEHEPNIVVQRTLFPANYRWNRAHRAADNDAPICRQINYREDGYAPLRPCDQLWFNQQDRYWEDDVGRREPLPGLWGGETGWRVSTLNPNSLHCMELYAWSLASADAFVFTKGGFVVGTIGLEEPLGRFAQSLRALPAVKFADVPGLSDPVAVRQYHQGSRTYFYAVNRLSCPVKLRLELAGRPHAVTELRTGQAVAANATSDGDELRIALTPYALQSFAADGPEIRVSAGKVVTPESYVQELKDHLADLERRAAALPAEEAQAGGFAAYLTQAHHLLSRGYWGQLQHLLEDAPAAALGDQR